MSVPDTLHSLVQGLDGKHSWLDTATKELLKQTWKSYQDAKEANSLPSQAVARVEQDLDKRAKRLASLEATAVALDEQVRELQVEAGRIKAQIAAERLALESAKKEAAAKVAAKVGLPEAPNMALQLDVWNAVAKKMSDEERNVLMATYERTKAELLDERAQAVREAANRVDALAAAAAPIASASTGLDHSDGGGPPQQGVQRASEYEMDIESFMAGLEASDLKEMVVDPEKRKLIQEILGKSKKLRTRAPGPSDSG